MIKKIKSENLSEKVVKQIIKLIENNELKPGDKLPPENEFAEKLGVSRGILREALTILQFQGFISRKPKDGTYIREISLEEISADSMVKSLKDSTYIDLIELREALELKAIELAIKRADSKSIYEIKQYLESVNVDDENYSISDYNFHMKIAELSKNVLIMNFIDTSYDLIREMGEKSNHNRRRKIEIFEEHKNLINAILERDMIKAKDSLRFHLSKVKENVLKEKTY